MGTPGRVIYTQHGGKMTAINQPRQVHRANFLIQWKGLDWSGFLTIEQCKAQFPNIESRHDVLDDNFRVIEA
jgi:hypothetical protein